jgi:transposase
LERMGARIPSATLNRWWGRGADLLLPVAASVRLSLLMDSHIRSDGTGLRVVFPRLLAAPKKGEARQGNVDADGYLRAKDPVYGQVLVFGNDEHTVFHFTLNREGHHIDEFLTLGVTPQGDPLLWQGTITADASSVYDHLYVAGERIESGCNGHALRKFRDDADKAPLLAAQAMHYIGQMFSAEEEARDRHLRGAELLAHRNARAGPVATEFRAWLEEHVTDLLPSHDIRKAMQYYLNHWDALTHFLLDPAVNLDNNWSERALRKIALFRNASLFVGGEEGARRLCAVLTLVQTARQLDLDPCAYLQWAMERAVPHPNNRGIQASDLTPAAYKAAQQVKADQV